MQRERTVSFAEMERMMKAQQSDIEGHGREL